MKIAIIGSRSFPRLDLVVDLVASLAPGSVVISGGAKGVDSTAEECAKLRGLEVIQVPAKWRTHGIYNPRAGIERNGEIVGQADEVHAFVSPCSKCKSRCPASGWSHGTYDGMKKAIRAQKPLTVTAVTEDGRVVEKHFNDRLHGIPDFAGGV